MSSSRWAVAAAAFAAVALVAPAARAADSLVGTWEHQASNGVSLVVTFDADGSGKMNDTKMKWTVSGQSLSIAADGDTNTYSFKLDGNTLVVSGGDLEAPTTFTRKSAPKKSGLGGQMKPDPEKEKKGATVIGKWKSATGSEEIELTKDTLKLGPSDVPMEIAPDALVLTTKKGEKVKWPYKLDGDTLEITVGTQKQVWKRATGMPVAEKPAAPAAKKKTLVGKWTAEDGTVIQFNADGTFLYGGQSLAYKASDDAITINGNEWKYKLDGDSLVLTLPGEEPTTLRRAAGGADEAPKDEGGEKVEAGKGGGDVVGAWDSRDGTTILRADGTGTSKDGDFKWSIEKINDKPMLKFVQGEKWLALPYTCQGDKLVLGSGPAITLTRAGIAGVWVGEEAVLDPGNYLSFTQYLVLYKDGSVGYAKSEGYASRTQVTENWERFYSGGEKGAEKKSVGTWKKTGPNTISLKLSWREQELKGQYDLNKMILRVEGMGKLPGNEGGSLDFKRK